MKEDRNVYDLVDGHFTFLNEPLAKFYGIAGVKGSEFRRVELPSDSPRGGVLTQGAVLLATSTPTRTSPVIRGKWIIEQILGTPPPAPPADVPPLDEQRAVNQTASLRERMSAAFAARGVRWLPQAHGPARLRAGEFRRHRRLARHGRQVSDRCRRQAARWPQIQRTAGAEGHPEKRRLICEDARREDDDLRARPRPRLRRHVRGEEGRRGRAQGRRTTFPRSSPPS